MDKLTGDDFAIHVSPPFTPLFPVFFSSPAGGDGEAIRFPRGQYLHLTPVFQKHDPASMRPRANETAPRPTDFTTTVPYPKLQEKPITNVPQSLVNITRFGAPLFSFSSGMLQLSLFLQPGFLAKRPAPTASELETAITFHDLTSLLKRDALEPSYVYRTRPLVSPAPAWPQAHSIL